MTNFPSPSDEPSSRTQARPPRFVIALRCGRLANRLVLFANFAAFAEERGYLISNVTFHSYAGLFETTRRDIYCRYPVPRRASLVDSLPGLSRAIRKSRIFYHLVRVASVLNERYAVFGRGIITIREPHGQRVVSLAGPEFQAQIRGAKIIFVYGWGFRAPSLLRKHAAKIREFFQPIEEHECSSRQIVDGLRRGSGVVVGVHIRQGDYRTWKHGAYFFSPAQYAHRMRELAGQFPGRKVSFLACSDEPRHSGEFPGLDVAFGAGTPIVDLYALAKCDYIFGPPSTFSQWASFYGEAPMFVLKDPGAPIELNRFQVSDLADVP